MDTTVRSWVRTRMMIHDDRGESIPKLTSRRLSTLACSDPQSRYP